MEKMLLSAHIEVRLPGNTPCGSAERTLFLLGVMNARSYTRVVLVQFDEPLTEHPCDW